MNVNIIREDKNEVEFHIDNLTVAEILRNYLTEEVDFVAWRREHPLKPLVMRIESKNKTVRKAVSDAVAAIKKDLDKVGSVLKKK